MTRDSRRPGIDLVVIVAAGDLLHPEALAELAHHAEVHPLVDALYTDEEQAGEVGGAPEPFLKPDWSPELLLSLPYVLHCLCLRRDLYVRMGGLTWGADEAGVYDFALRATSAARAVGHVARVLCRRPRPPIAHDVTCLRAVAAAAASLAPPADAAPGLIPGTYRIVRSRDQRPPVTLVVITGDPIVDVPGRGARRILADFIRTIVELSTYPDFRILVVDDGELSEESDAVVSKTHSRSISHNRAGAELRGFSFSRKVNFALEHVETEHFVLLNDDLTVVTPDWIEALMDYGVSPQVGAVGAHLEFPDGRTQHAGVVATPSGPTHRFYGLPPGARDRARSGRRGAQLLSGDGCRAGQSSRGHRGCRAIRRGLSSLLQRHRLLLARASSRLSRRVLPLRTPASLRARESSRRRADARGTGPVQGALGCVV